MRKAIKDASSEVVVKALKYISGNSTNNKKIAAILLKEQRGYCVYTDEYISRTDSRDVEHFNPTLKGKEDDNYSNWFVVKHQWNKEKSIKWEDFQPVLHPTASDLEARIMYVEGDYLADPQDIEANNLIKLLKLDDLELADKRKKYIRRKKSEIDAYSQGAADIFFSTLLNEGSCEIHYLRAIKEVFGVDIWTMLV